MVQDLNLKIIYIFPTLSKFLCFLSRLAANAFALSTSIMRSSYFPCSLSLVFSREAHLELTVSMDSLMHWMASVSYLVLHWATSLLALDIPRWSSALASCSSSKCSLSKSQSWRQTEPHGPEHSWPLRQHILGFPTVLFLQLFRLSKFNFQN